MKSICIVVVLFALIAVPSLALANGSPAAPNMDTIRRQFAAKDAEIANLKAQIALLKEQVYDLRQALVSKHAQAIYDRDHPAPEPVYGPLSSFSLSYVPPAEPQPAPVASSPASQPQPEQYADNTPPPYEGFLPGGFVGYQPSDDPYAGLPSSPFPTGMPMGASWSTPGDNQLYGVLGASSMGVPGISSYSGYFPSLPYGL